jgi:hypothetical protein
VLGVVVKIGDMAIIRPRVRILDLIKFILDCLNGLFVANDVKGGHIKIVIGHKIRPMF